MRRAQHTLLFWAPIHSILRWLMSMRRFTVRWFSAAMCHIWSGVCVKSVFLGGRACTARQLDANLMLLCHAIPVLRNVRRARRCMEPAEGPQASRV